MHTKFKTLRNKHGPYAVEYAVRQYPEIAGTRCWLWLGAILNTGYGAFNINATTMLAHRYAYSCVYPDENISKLQIMHKCDVRKCVRPLHLLSGTNTDNSDDKTRKYRCNAVYGDVHYKAVLTVADVRLIVKKLRQGTTGRELALEYGVSDSIISEIKHGKKWKHITNPKESITLRSNTFR